MFSDEEYRGSARHDRYDDPDDLRRMMADDDVDNPEKRALEDRPSVRRF